MADFIDNEYTYVFSNEVIVTAERLKISSRRPLKWTISIILLFNMLVPRIYSQETTSLAPSIKLNGYVKSDIFFDTREVISAREGHFLLSPTPVVLLQHDQYFNNG